MKKTTAIIILTLMILSVFTSCGGGTEITLMDFLGADTGELDLGGQKIILIGESDPEYGLIDGTAAANTTLYDCILGRFDEINKKYNCVIDYKFYENTDVYETLFQAQMSSGTLKADIIYGHGNSKLQVFAEAGLLYPLTNLKEYLDYENSEKFGSAGLLEGAMVNGTPFAVQPCYWPGFQNNFNNVFVYNPTIVTQQGLPDLHEYYENETWTWDVFQPMIENFDKGGDDNTYAMSTMENQFSMMALASNGVKGVDYADGVLKSDISSPQAVRAVEWMQDIFLNNEENILIIDTWELNAFIDGRAMLGMAVTLHLTASELQYASSIQFSIMPFPSGPDGVYGDWAQYTAAIRGLSIPANHDNPEVPARIINDLCEPFEEFGGSNGLEEYFNEYVFFDPLDTEIYFALGENIRYTYWRTSPSLADLFNTVADRFDDSSATEILSGFEPKLQAFVDNTLKANFENYLYEHLYANN